MVNVFKSIQIQAGLLFLKTKTMKSFDIRNKILTEIKHK